MDSLNKLTEIFRSFPGIGPRQAKRFSYYLLTRNKKFLSDLARLILSIHDDIETCKQCFRFFPKSRTGGMTCLTCDDANRDHTILMLVSRDVDLENMEGSHAYQGLYFILGGSVPILEKEPEKRVRIKELKERVSNTPELKEIIIATNVNPEGENTASYIKSQLEPIIKDRGIKISTLGRGLSTGTELEYSDSETIKSALKNRY